MNNSLLEFHINTRTIKTISRLLKPLSNIAKKISHPKEGQRVILMYHGISKSPKFNCVTQSLLREQISWLKEKYFVVPLNTLIESLDSDSFMAHSNLASITFDDGYNSFAELALPVLQALNCHATVFIPSGKAGSCNDWEENSDEFYKMKIMSYEAIRQLPIESVEIGSHGISHIALNRLSFREIERELVESSLEIEQNISRPVRFFAFPYGVYPFKHRHRLYDDKAKLFLGGYKAACTTWWGRYNSLKDTNRLRRIGIWDSDSFDDFTDKLNGYYDWLVGKERIGRGLKIIRSFL
ncbi:MAG: polysaccharide deacetylase family protein [Nitrospirota bacterium]